MSSLRAILLDVDGTLYYQRPLRLFMALELSTLPVARKSGRSTISVLNTLRSFRSIREELRQDIGSGQSLLDLQYQKTAERVGRPRSEVEAVVEEWIYQRPLKYLRICKRRGLDTFLSYAEGNGLHIGVFSDYPVQEKLQALGLTHRVKLSLCATDREISVFKPHPRGFLRACEVWAVKPEEVLYVGDRFEVDGQGATAAGMPCAILTGLGKHRKKPSHIPHLIEATSFRELQHVLKTPSQS